MTTTEETMMTDRTETRCRDCDGYNCDNGCAYPPKNIEMQIPDDIAMTAEEVTFAVYKVDMWFHARDIIARAILAERERCAKVAEKYNHGIFAAEAIRGFEF